MTVFQEAGINSVTQPNLMNLVLFSSVEYALSNNVQHMTFFSSQGTENPSVPLFLGHPV